MHLQDHAMECLAWAAERQQEAEEQLHQLDAQLRYRASSAGAWRSSSADLV